ncbi:MAG: MarR family transcriptional regulator [Pseudomonadota bacterium]|nr:MarR family transcriptional regulator [Pseudomonadota bacterium]
MPTLPQELLRFVHSSPGLTDREITDALRGKLAPQQPVNIAARSLATRGQIVRRKRADGLIGNYPSDGLTQSAELEQTEPKAADLADQSEDKLKHRIREWLTSDGWHVEVAWARDRGIDVRAFRDGKRWIIEVKGIGSLPAMRVNYFLSILGETLQRMDDPASKYSICLPDVPQFRNLWSRLPTLAKRRTEITALFVASSGCVEEVSE